MLKASNSALIVVDVQGRLAQVMHDSETVQKNIVNLIKGVQLLNIPIVWLEQYPEGLGPTTDDIKQLLEDDNKSIAKKRFSPCQTEPFQTTIDHLKVDNFIVAGIEAHICVYQTVRELLNAGKNVEYVADCISSRTIENKNIAMKKMNLLGAMPTSVEMVLFELIESAEHPKFRDISRIIK